ncbi:serine/threonine-protein kinase [Microbulbifer sp. YPW16]|uniref:serine/threonine-protein kinase n=1 Tax=Microbulbifer sp. YPW16 TaxID=2904242 RepID=UPI001E3F6FDD|nr:serine/threonine-protein kinase [Microbulbifer sp. YPW16]UHQ53702.1 protein kinase [Microbulbifer sp. YPW16]
MDSPDIQIPGYTIHAAIGHGGMASVYLATQESLDRKVAIKVLRNCADAEFGQRFINEARFIAGLNNPHLITIYDVASMESGDYYIAMEFVGNGDVIENADRFTRPAPILALIRQVAEGLSIVHDNGIIHRDVKPTNILFRADGTAVLTDFGIAKNVESDSDLTQSGLSLGSPSYSSPEQAQCHPLDITTDIYSLGVVLLELLLGRNPFKGDSHTSTAVNHIQLPVPELPEEFDYLAPLVERMLAKDPRDRYPSCRELIADIDRVLEGDDSQQTDITLPFIRQRRLAGPAGQKAKLLTVASCVLLLTVYFGFFYKTPTEREIERLLEQAQLSMDAGRFMLPTGNNARNYYSQVLALDNSNLEAILGRKTAEKKQLDSYLKQGAQALQDGRLQQPEGNNALHYYRQALALDQDNARANAGIARVIDEFVRLARVEIDQNDLRNAHFYVDSGLSIQPENDVLLSLSDELKQRQQRQQQQHRQQVREVDAAQPVARRSKQAPKKKQSTVRTHLRNIVDKFRDVIDGDR